MAKSDKMTSISSIRLKQAREHYGLSPFEVCQRIKTIKIEDLYNYESGTDFPSYTKLEALANLYNRPLLYFFFRSEPSEDKLAIAFRSVESNTGYNLSMQVKTMIEKADLFRLNLSELFNDSPPIRFITLLEDDEIDTSEKLLVWLRTQLELPLTMQKNKFTKADSLLEYLRDKLYDIGVYVFKDSFKADNVSGLCLYDEDYPIIMLNAASDIASLFTGFQVLYAVHLNTNNSHVHFVINSVSASDGLKFNQSKYDLRHLKSIVDEIVHPPHYSTTNNKLTNLGETLNLSGFHRLVKLVISCLIFCHLRQNCGKEQKINPAIVMIAGFLTIK